MAKSKLRLDRYVVAVESDITGILWIRSGKATTLDRAREMADPTDRQLSVHELRPVPARGKKKPTPRSRA